VTDRIKVYFAGPLFTQAEWMWNETVVNELRKCGIIVALPQERSITTMTGEEQFDPKLLFDENAASIKACDAVIAVLDQADVDSGTAWECGYAFGLGKPVIGIRSDFRNSGDDGELPINLMLARSIKAYIQVPISKRSDTSWLGQEVIKLLDSTIRMDRG
jgi:nucleoside 2-deoxyribosyltransferase